jgi:hypothetical protein
VKASQAFTPSQKGIFNGVFHAMVRRGATTDEMIPRRRTRLFFQHEDEDDDDNPQGPPSC